MKRSQIIIFLVSVVDFFYSLVRIKNTKGHSGNFTFYQQTPVPKNVVCIYEYRNNCKFCKNTGDIFEKFLDITVAGSYGMQAVETSTCIVETVNEDVNVKNTNVLHFNYDVTHCKDFQLSPFLAAPAQLQLVREVMARVLLYPEMHRGYRNLTLSRCSLQTPSGSCNFTVGGSSAGQLQLERGQFVLNRLQGGQLFFLLTRRTVIKRRVLPLPVKHVGVQPVSGWCKYESAP